MQEKIVAVVLGNSFSTIIGVVKSLGQRNITTDVMMLVQKTYAWKTEIIKSSKYVRDFLSVSEGCESLIIDNLIERYKDRGETCVLLTTGDYFASLLDRHYDELKPYFLMPYAEDENGRQGRITYLMDKSVQSQLARSVGIPTAAEWSISLKTDSLQIPEDIPYPCFVKTAVSCLGAKTEMAVCKDKEELAEHLLKFQKYNSDRSVLIQEWLDIADEYIITGVSFDQDVRVVALSRRIRVAEHRRGLTICGEIVDFSVIPGWEERFMELLKKYHYVGMFGMDVFRLRDGRIMFNEMNFRSTGVVFGLTQAGANLPYMLVQFLLGKSVEPQNVKYHSTFFHEKVAYEEYRYGVISKRELNRYRRQSDFTILEDAHDTKPYKVFIRNTKALIMRNRRKATKRKVYKFVKTIRMNGKKRR